MLAFGFALLFRIQLSSIVIGHARWVRNPSSILPLFVLQRISLISVLLNMCSLYFQIQHKMTAYADVSLPFLRMCTAPLCSSKNMVCPLPFLTQTRNETCEHVFVDWQP